MKYIKEREFNENNLFFGSCTFFCGFGCLLDWIFKTGWTLAIFFMLFGILGVFQQSKVFYRKVKK